MKTLPLSNSDKVALVSDADWPELSRYRWFLKSSAWTYYVCRSVRVGDKIQTHRLHRIIAQRILGDMSLPDNMDVHHGPDPDPLNCMRENLGLMEHTLHGRESVAKRN